MVFASKAGSRRGRDCRVALMIERGGLYEERDYVDVSTPEAARFRGLLKKVYNFFQKFQGGVSIPVELTLGIGITI